MGREDEEQKRRPRRINYTPKGVPCKSCKHSLPVDARHNNYYCVNVESVIGIHRGEHVCGRGESKEVKSESL